MCKKWRWTCVNFIVYCITDYSILLEIVVNLKFDRDDIHVLMHSHDTNQSNMLYYIWVYWYTACYDIIDRCGLSNELHFELHNSKG